MFKHLRVLLPLRVLLSQSELYFWPILIIVLVYLDLVFYFNHYLLSILMHFLIFFSHESVAIFCKYLK